jgi:hypothetical protein
MTIGRLRRARARSARALARVVSVLAGTTGRDATPIP